MFNREHTLCAQGEKLSSASRILIRTGLFSEIVNSKRTSGMFSSRLRRASEKEGEWAAVLLNPFVLINTIVVHFKDFYIIF